MEHVNTLESIIHYPISTNHKEPLKLKIIISFSKRVRTNAHNVF